MAFLFDLHNQQPISLTPFHSIGRLPHFNHLVLDNPYISKLHGLIEWYQSHWTLRDMSHNGIWLNQQRVNRHVRYILQCGDHICFAQQLNFSFKITDLSAPCDQLIPLDHDASPLSLQQYHLLPHPNGTKTVLFYHRDKTQWCLQKHNDEK